jgi:hypothetical protein
MRTICHVYDDEDVSQEDSIMGEVYPLDASDMNEDAIWSDEVIEFRMPCCYEEIIDC